MRSETLKAAILVGGQSRRMGTNKALLTIDPAGSTVVETVVRTVRQVAEDVVLVGANGADYAFLGMPTVVDHVSGLGPLGGIHAALMAVESDHLLVVACDMPFLNVDLLRFMASRPRTYDVLVPVVGQPQPLHAIYAPACLPLIERQLVAGRHQATGWYDDANVHKIEQSVVQGFDPFLRSCFNMNTPDELAEARSMLATAG